MCSKHKDADRCAVTAQLICLFVFAYTDCWFSHAGAHIGPVVREGTDHQKTVTNDLLKGISKQ